MFIEIQQEKLISSKLLTQSNIMTFDYKPEGLSAISIKTRVNSSP